MLKYASDLVCNTFKSKNLFAQMKDIILKKT